jgi:hypothetical protein
VMGVRAISLVCGVALIPLSALFGAIVGGRRVGLLTAGFVALSAPLIDYSQEARAYALLTLLVIGSAIGLLLTLRAMIRDNIFDVRPAVIFAISALLAFYTHFVALFWIGPAVVLLALTAARSGDASVQRATRLTILAMIFFALPGAARLFASMTNDIGFDWLPQASLGQFFATLAEQILPLGMWSPKPSDPGRASSFVALVLTVFLAGVAYWRAGVRMRQLRADFPASAQVLAIFLLLPFVLWAFGALSKPIFMPRTMLWSVPGILTVIALLLDRLDRRWLMAMNRLSLCGQPRRKRHDAHRPPGHAAVPERDRARSTTGRRADGLPYLASAGIAPCGDRAVTAATAGAVGRRHGNGRAELRLRPALAGPLRLACYPSRAQTNPSIDPDQWANMVAGEQVQRARSEADQSLARPGALDSRSG